jgi:hypothetical protein
MDYHKKYLKYKQKYLLKKQIGGRSIEIIKKDVSKASSLIASVHNYLRDGVVIPQGIPPTLRNYAESKAFQKILGFARVSLKYLDSSKKELLELKSPEVVADKDKEKVVADEELKKVLLTQIDEEETKARTLTEIINCRIAELPYNIEEAKYALNEHQKHLKSPNFDGYQSLKNSCYSAKTFDEAEPIRKRMMAKCVEVEIQLAIWEAVGYFQKNLEHEASIEYSYRL